MRQFRPGDHVELRNRADDPEPYANGVILYENEDGQAPCPLHDDPMHECWEWANVILDLLGEDGQTAINLYSCHVGECKMRLSEFGQGLRED